jgi:hypothetical protein
MRAVLGERADPPAIARDDDRCAASLDAAHLSFSELFGTGNPGPLFRRRRVGVAHADTVAVNERSAQVRGTG